jgi:hypothetical protein
MQVTLKQPLAFESLNNRLTEAQCPVRDLRFGTFTCAQIEDFVIAFAAFFFYRHPADVDLDTNIHEALVLRHFKDHHEDPFETDLTGISAGAITHLLFVLVVEDALGLDVSETDEDPDLETIGGLVTYLVLALRSVGKMVES